MTIKTLIVGLGKIGMGYDLKKKKQTILTHCNSVSKSKRFELVGGVDNDLKKKIIFKKNYNRPFFSDLKKGLLETKPSFVIISVNTIIHYKIIKKIINTSIKYNIGINTILIEKPVGQNYQEAKKILDLCKKNKVCLLVNYFRNYDKKFLSLKKYNKYFTYGIVNYSGGMINNGSHFLSLFIILFGKIKKIIKLNKNTLNRYDFKFTGIIFFEKAKILFKNNLSNLGEHKFSLINSCNYIQYNNLTSNISILFNKKKNILLNNLILKDPQKIVLSEVYKHLTNQNNNICTGNFAVEIFKNLTKIKKI